MTLERLAEQMTLGGVLDALRGAGGYELLAHWQQGEFHHDTLLRVDAARVGVPGPVLVVATNCNGGVKEIFAFAERPDRYALWHRRCPDNPEFSGDLPRILGVITTVHWFDPCALLTAEARSELRPEFRERELGGGWKMRGRSRDLPRRLRRRSVTRPPARSSSRAGVPWVRVAGFRGLRPGTGRAPDVPPTATADAARRALPVRRTFEPLGAAGDS